MARGRFLAVFVIASPTVPGPLAMSLIVPVLLVGDGRGRRRQESPPVGRVQRVLNAPLMPEAVAGVTQEGQLVRVMWPPALSPMDVVDLAPGRTTPGTFTKKSRPGTDVIRHQGGRIGSPCLVRRGDGTLAHLGEGLGSRSRSRSRRRWRRRRRRRARVQPALAHQIGDELGQRDRLPCVSLMFGLDTPKTSNLLLGEVQRDRHGTARGEGLRIWDRVLRSPRRFVHRRRHDSSKVDARSSAHRPMLRGLEPSTGLLYQSDDLPLRELAQVALPSSRVQRQDLLWNAIEDRPPDDTVLDELPEPRPRTQAPVQRQHTLDGPSTHPTHFLCASDQAGEGALTVQAAPSHLREDRQETLPALLGQASDLGEMSP